MITTDTYVGYSGFVAEAKALRPPGERLSIVGRHRTDAVCGPADVVVLIKPGTAKLDATQPLPRLS
jgi:hypothetical protein